VGGERGALVSRTAFVFPGQGSQLPGMGRALAETFPEAREVFERADRCLGMPLSLLCFEGTEQELLRTEVTQPALLAVSVATAQVLASKGIEPAALAGHSLGEWTAHVVARSLPLEEALVAVRTRGRLMQEAVPMGEGAMAAILGLGAREVERACEEARCGQVVAAANYNGPGQVVIAGHREAVERAIELALRAGAKRAVPLPVSAPFHCSLMAPAERGLAPLVRELPFSDPQIPVYSNVTARPVRTGAEAADLLLRQISAPVRWQEVVEAMRTDGIDTFIEVGPGRVLSALIRRIAPESRVLAVADPPGVEAAFEAVGWAR
jgi:[acyl-carrier-protein] S-malonyltransferase